ncbi:MAG TPA: hypothetical protein VKN73_06460 [Desulfosalsimonadaceae bacterium]|nr:hypothetical protein [Desulfosalsimonadaceae bacterium]
MEERELISLVIGCLVMGFVLFEWRRLRRIPNFGLLFSCFTLLFVSWSLSAIENFFFDGFFNFLPHLASGVSAILLFAWCRSVYRAPKKGAHRP